MRRWNLIRSGVLTLCVAGVTACGDQDVVSLADTTDPSISAATLALEPRGGEEVFFALAAQVPSFAGFYRDDGGDLVVLVAHAGDQGRARAAVAPYQASMRRDARLHGRAGSPHLRFGVVSYSYRDLAGWRARVNDRLFDVPGTLFTAIDVAGNRFEIGVSADGVSEAEVRTLLADAGVPFEAVVVHAIRGVSAVDAQETQPAVLESGTGVRAELMAAGTTLRDRVRPVVAGLMIQRPDAENRDIWYSGTLGPVAHAEHIGIVAFGSSFFSPRWATTDWADYFQAGEYIGAEYGDPATKKCSWFSQYRCRESDSFSMLLYAQTTTERGYIARPTHYNGSITIDPDRPRFTVAGVATPELEMSVDKVGGSTGWTYGKVVRRNVDVRFFADDRVVRNTAWASYPANTGGDRGAPVFHWTIGMEHVTLVGTHIGRYSFDGWGTVSVLDRFDGIVADMNSWTFTPPNHGKITVTPVSSGGGDTGGGGGCIGSDTDLICAY